jgi:hypothetical protein
MKCRGAFAAPAASRVKFRSARPGGRRLVQTGTGVESDVLFHRRINEAVAVLRQYRRPSLAGSAALKACRSHAIVPVKVAQRVRCSYCWGTRMVTLRIVVIDNALSTAIGCDPGVRRYALHHVLQAGNWPPRRLSRKMPVPQTTRLLLLILRGRCTVLVPLHVALRRAHAGRVHRATFLGAVRRSGLLHAGLWSGAGVLGKRRAA